MTEQEYFYIDGEYVKSQDATIPVLNHSFLYGTCVFEGIRAYYNKEENQLYAFRMKEHFERLLNSGKIMRMYTDKSVDELCEIAKETFKRSNYHCDAYMRPQIYKKAQSVCPSVLGMPDGLMMLTLKLGDYCDLEKGLRVCVSSWKRSDDNAIPPRAKISGCYANTALIVSDAKAMGFDDAIVLGPDGHVTEGSAMNLFLVQNGKLVTSNITDNILIGVTRNTVIELAKNELGIETVERPIDRTELYISDEAFYCGTGAQISPITEIDNRPVGDGKVGEIAKKIQALYFDTVKGKVEKYKKWCTPIYD